MSKPNLPANVDPLQWVGPDDPSFAQSDLIHCVHLPQKAKSAPPIPAVVMVHGWGGDETVMWIFKQTVPADTIIITPRAPFTVEDDKGFTWFKGEHHRPDQNSLKTALDKLQHFLDALPELYPVDSSRIILMGFSQGAAIINALMFTQPELKKNVIGLALLAGAMLPLPDDAPAPDQLAGLPVFIGHGTEDNIIPLAEARQVRETYLAAGADVTYKEYRTGHKMNSQGMKDLTAWLAERLMKVN